MEEDYNLSWACFGSFRTRGFGGIGEKGGCVGGDLVLSVGGQRNKRWDPPRGVHT